jgi:acyl carrier protein
MVPEVMVEVEEWPQTANGKIDRRALPAPEPMRSELTGVFISPQTPVEEMVAQVWAETLGIDRVGRNDNFFELGGHSLLATQAISRVRDACAVELPLRNLFEAQTVAEFAVHIEAAWRAGQGLETPPLTVVGRDGELPLSFAQQRLWFLDQMGPGLSAYNMPGAIRLSGQLNVSALERSLEEVVRRHEILRTRFAQVEGRPVQVINEAQDFTLAVDDLRQVEETERPADVLRRVMEEAQRPFDLAAGPLVRARLFRVEDEEQVLLLTMHHIISDGWSVGVLIREAAANY